MSTHQQDTPELEGRSERTAPLEPVHFYTVGDANFFIGIVALVNSLRVVSHDEPITVIDIGLTASQRAVLGAHCEVRSFKLGADVHPAFGRGFVRLTDPDGIVVLLDADPIVTGRLDRLVNEAREGRICVLADGAAARWFGEWKEIFGLARVPRRQPDVNSGCVIFSTRNFPDLLERWWALCERILGRPTCGTVLRGTTRRCSLTRTRSMHC